MVNNSCHGRPNIICSKHFSLYDIIYTIPRHTSADSCEIMCIDTEENHALFLPVCYIGISRSLFSKWQFVNNNNMIISSLMVGVWNFYTFNTDIYSVRFSLFAFLIKFLNKCINKDAIIHACANWFLICFWISWNKKDFPFHWKFGM